MLGGMSRSFVCVAKLFVLFNRNRWGESKETKPDPRVLAMMQGENVKKKKLSNKPAIAFPSKASPKKPEIAFPSKLQNLVQ